MLMSIVILCLETTLVGAVETTGTSPPPPPLAPPLPFCVVVVDDDEEEEGVVLALFQESESKVASRRLLITVDLPTAGGPMTVMEKVALSMAAERWDSRLRSRKMFERVATVPMYCWILSRNHLSVDQSGSTVSLADRFLFVPSGVLRECRTG